MLLVFPIISLQNDLKHIPLRMDSSPFGGGGGHSSQALLLMLFLLKI